MYKVEFCFHIFIHSLSSFSKSLSKPSGPASYWSLPSSPQCLPPPDHLVLDETLINSGISARLSHITEPQPLSAALRKTLPPHWPSLSCLMHASV